MELFNHFIPPIILEKEQRKSYDKKKAFNFYQQQFIYENASVYESSGRTRFCKRNDG